MANIFGPYRVFGFVLRSEMPLPDLAPADGSAEGDVTIRLGHATRPSDVADVAEGVAAGSGRFWMDVPEMARILVRSGTDIVVEPYAGADDASIRAFLLGSAMGALLHQRGLLPLHASAVAMGGGAVAFMGTSGAGKSTIALHLADRGHPPISDDICALDVSERGVVLHPGPPRMKLWEGSLAATGRTPGGLARVLPTLDKYQLPVAGGAGDAVPLRAVVLLDRSATTAVETLAGVAAARALIANTFRGELVAPMGRSHAHFHQCLAVARAPGVLRLTREWSLDRLAVASAAIEDRIAATRPACHVDDTNLS